MSERSGLAGEEPGEIATSKSQPTTPSKMSRHLHSQSIWPNLVNEVAPRECDGPMEVGSLSFPLTRENIHDFLIVSCGNKQQL